MHGASAENSQYTIQCDRSVDCELPTWCSSQVASVLTHAATWAGADSMDPSRHGAGLSRVALSDGLMGAIWATGM